MNFTLPYPPTANLYWRVWRGRAVKSKKAREYQRKVALLAKSRARQPIIGPVGVHVDVYRPAKRGDLDNTLKVLLDALKGIAYADDSQVVSLHACRHEDPDSPRAEVFVWSEAKS